MAAKTKGGGGVRGGRGVGVRKAGDVRVCTTVAACLQCTQTEMGQGVVLQCAQGALT